LREQRSGKESEEDSPARSILGLGKVEPSSLWLSTARGRNGGPPPTSSLLGLEGIELSPSRIPAPVPGADGAPPATSLLGLQDLRPAPLSRPVPPADPNAEPPNRSLLGLGTYRPPPGSRPLAVRRPAPAAAPAASAAAVSPTFFGLATGAPAVRPVEAASRSFFGLQGPPAATSLGRLSAGDAAEIVPEFEKDVEHRAEPAFPVERAVFASLVAHALLLVLLLWAPAAKHDPRKGLLAALVPPQPSAEDKVPIIFREAPGPARENPKKSDLSDADRRAGGGDPAKPKAQSPFVPERPGKQGLRPGPARPPSPPPVPPPGQAVRQAEAGRGPAAPSPGEGKTPESEARDPQPFAVPRSSSGNTSQEPGGRSAPTLQGLNQAIRDAARGVGGGGEQGSGFPNPGGGFVDSGPLSFDTTWYDWGPYAAEMIRRIKLHWDVPDLARFGWKGKVTVRFFILADGRVDGATILSRSGVPPFDYAAFQAILTSSPFRPLPKDLGSEREGVTVTFFYNIRPGESEGGSSN
jgi:TonB family protein